MSYSICLRNNQFDSYYFPFSGNDTYDDFWERMIKKFNLKMVGLIGVSFDEQMYKEFFKEMHDVKKYLESLSDNEDNDKGHLERINFILERLKEKKDKYKYLSIE